MVFGRTFSRSAAVVSKKAAVRPNQVPGAQRRFSRLVNLDAAARSVVSDLNLARQLARSNRRHIRVAFAGNTVSFKDGTKEIKSGTIPAGIKFSYPKTLGFAASGFPSPGEAGTVIIGNMGQGQRKVVVSSLGRIRVE